MNPLLFLVPGGNVVGALSSAFAGFIRFATSTVGMIFLAALVAYGTGWHLRGKKCDSERLRIELAAVKADLDAANIAASMAEAQSAELEAEDRENKGKIDALAADLKSRKDRHCGLSRDDARRLRDIR